MIASASNPAAAALFILFICAVAAIGVISELRKSRAGRSRVTGLRDLAARLSFDSFEQESDAEFTRGWGFLNRLSKGEDRYAFNILRGDYHGQALFVFDYHYQTGSGKSREDHWGTILMLVVKEAFPQLTIGPENFQDKLEAAFGLGNEISFESAEFSRKFSVRSADKKFAYDVCNPKMMEYLLLNPYLQIEIQGPVISLAFEPQLPVEQIEFNLQRLAEIRSRLPEYIFTQNT